MNRKRKSEGGSRDNSTKQSTLNFIPKSSAPVEESLAARIGAPCKAQVSVQCCSPTARSSQQHRAETSVPVLSSFTVLPVLSREALHHLEQLAEDYKRSWAEKCSKKSFIGDKGHLPDKDEAEVDSVGLRFLEHAKLVLEQGYRQDAVIPRGVLEVFILMLRNDAVHKHSYVSRQAFSLLGNYLQHFSAVKVGKNNMGKPVVLTSTQRLPQYKEAAPSERNNHIDTFWSSLEDPLKSFSRQHILVKALGEHDVDMVVSGEHFKYSQGDGCSKPSSRMNRFRGSYDFIYHLFKEALASEKINRDGDLMLLYYLLEVLEQDTRCRLTVFSAYKQEEAVNDKVPRQRKILLKESLLWRICEEMGAETSKVSMVKLLMQIISGAPVITSYGSSSGNEEAWVMNDATTASAAEVAIFTRQQLSAMAAQFLRLQLELFGAMEDAGGFLATSRFRGAHTNLRMQLDKLMLDCFWGSEMVCWSDKLSRSFLHSLPPRDRLRFLGMLIAHTFSLTYNDRASLSSKPSLQELVHAERLLKYGGDAAGYVDVNILQALRSITQDQSRAFKVYKNKCHVQGDINLLATVVANVALALHALLASGWKPCTALKGDAKEQLLGGTKAQIQEELQAALKSIVDKSKDGRDEASLQLGQQSKVELMHAQMALTAFA